jgi:hypothetical protein
MPENADKYLCETCDFKCSKLSNYNTHLMTAKHIYRQNRTEKSQQNAVPEFACECGKIYKARNSLWYHKRVCKTLVQVPSCENIQNIPPQTVDMSVVLELLKQNNDFKQLVIEQTKQLFEQQQHNNQILEAVKDGKLGNNNCNNTTNSHNKFNLNVFLNETCKDAISMDDFINSLEVTRDDFIRTGNVGFVEGMSTVLVKRIRNMELHTRPMHCTDLKRETVYIKHDDKWEKEDTDKTHLRKAVKVAAHKNMNEMKKWYHDSKPEVDTNGTAEYEDYFKYYKSALGGFDKEEDKEFEEKIIKNVLKEVQVDKTSVVV